MPSNQIGYEGESVVKRKLWQYGFSVKHFGHSPYFDLLVNGEIKVEVKSCILNKNRFVAALGMGQHPCEENLKSDIFAFVFFYPDGTNLVRYATPSNLCQYMKKERERKGITKLSPFNKTGVARNVLFRNPDTFPLEKSPLKIFGKGREGMRPKKQVGGGAGVLEAKIKP